LKYSLRNSGKITRSRGIGVGLIHLSRFRWIDVPYKVPGGDLKIPFWRRLAGGNGKFIV